MSSLISLQKEVKTDKYKFRGEAPKSARIEEVIEEEEFHAIFDGKGIQIQPTPDNKPSSTVIIKDFVGLLLLQESFPPSDARTSLPGM